MKAIEIAVIVLRLYVEGQVSGRSKIGGFSNPQMYGAFEGQMCLVGIT